MSNGFSGPTAAVVVTYNATENVEALIALLSTLLDIVVVVDNGSSISRQKYLVKLTKQYQVHLIQNSANLGIACALNKGTQFAKLHGAKWAFTFDQDSQPSKNMIPAMMECLNVNSSNYMTAQIGAKIIDAHLPGARRWLQPKHGRSIFFKRVRCEELVENKAAWTITSGTLMNLDVLFKLGGFQENLFIDMVDAEYSLRARAAGYAVKICCRAELLHLVGERSTNKFMGMTFYPTHHVAWRRYFSFRNRIMIIKRYGAIFPSWCSYEVMAAFNIVLCILLFEKDKFAKLRACVLGTWHGIIRNVDNTIAFSQFRHSQFRK